MQLGTPSRFVISALATLSASGCFFFEAPYAVQPERMLVSPSHVTLYVKGEEGNEQLFPSSAVVSVQVLDSSGKPVEGKEGEARWGVSDSAIAQVDAAGRLTAVATGSTTVVATSASKASLQATASVTVQDAGQADVVVK